MWSARQTRKMGRRVAGLLGGLLVGLLLAAAPAAAAPVDPINLSNSASIPSERPAIAVNRAGRVFVGWKEGNEIYFRRSEPTQGSCTGGLRFDPNEGPQSLWAGTGIPNAPALAVNDNGGVFVAWQASGAVWFSRSLDNGAPLTFSQAMNLGPNLSPLSVPSVAADNAGGVFVTWSNGSFTAEIFFARSTDSGQTFGLATNVSESLFVNSQAPSVATDGTSVFLAWEEGSGFFGVPIRLKKFGRVADLATVPGLPHVDPLSGTGLAGGRNPHLAFADGVLSVTFANLSVGPTGLVGAVYHRSSSDGGTTFSNAQALSGAGIPRMNPRAARGNGSAMVAWAHGLADADTEIQYSLPGPTATPTPVWPTLGARSVNPSAAVDSTGRLLWAWQESVNGSDEIYLSYSGGTGAGTTEATVWARGHGLDLKSMGRSAGERRHEQEDADEDDEQEDAEERSERGRGKHGRLTLYIELPDRSAGAIDLTTLKLNGQSVMPAKSKVGDKNHNGIPDMRLKFKLKWSDLQSVLGGAGLTAGQRSGNVTVTGSTTTGVCFSGTAAFRNKH